MSLLSKAFLGYDECLEFEVESCSKTYNVSFKKIDGSIHTSCTCKAGKNKTMCKHRTDILIGDFSSVIAPKVLKMKISTFLKKSRLEEHISYLKSLGFLKKIKTQNFNYSFNSSTFDEEFEKKEDELIFLPNQEEIFLPLEKIEELLFDKAFLVSKEKTELFYYCWNMEFKYQGQILKEEFKAKYPIGTKFNKFQIKEKNFYCLFPKNKAMAQLYIMANPHPYADIFSLLSITEEKKRLNKLLNILTKFY